MWKRFPRFVQDGSRGDDGLEGENPERARKQIRMWKWFPEISSRGDDGLESKSFESFRNF